MKTADRVEKNDAILPEIRRWQTSSRCITGECVAVGFRSDAAVLKDSKDDRLVDPQPMIELSPDCFAVFQDELLGQAPEGSNGELVVDRLDDGWVAFRSLSTGVTLRYDAEEFSAFVEGVRAGEFRSALATA